MKRNHIDLEEFEEFLQWKKMKQLDDDSKRSSSSSSLSLSPSNDNKEKPVVNDLRQAPLITYKDNEGIETTLNEDEMESDTQDKKEEVPFNKKVSWLPDLPGSTGTWLKTITIWCDTEDPAEWKIQREAIARWCSQHCERYVYQREVSLENKRQHWQMQISTKKRQKNKTVALSLGEYLQLGLNVRPTYRGTIGKFNYATKPGAEEGPYGDRKYVAEKEKNDGNEIPSDYLAAPEWEPWQVKLRELFLDNTARYRAIHVIVDPTGCKKKSYFQSWHNCRKIIVQLPLCDKPQDLVAFMLNMLESGEVKQNQDRHHISINFPRTLTATQQTKFWGGIEMLKDGELFDTRNKGRRRTINRPSIYVFCNHIPNKSDLSADRWDLRQINEQDELVNIDFPPHPEFVTETEFKGGGH